MSAFAQTVSTIELNVMTNVKTFLDAASTEAAAAKELNPEFGNKVIAEAIAKGISTALLDPIMIAAFQLIIDTNLAVVVPTGTLAYNLLSTALNAKSIPNPNLIP